MADTDLLFSSQFNYQKIALKGNTTDAVANSSGFPLSSTTITIPHNLGVIPSAKVWYDPENGRRFPISKLQFVDPDLSAFETNGITEKEVYLTTTNLVVIYYNSSGSSKDVTTYYRIYYPS